MKQLLQSMRRGLASVTDVPMPQVGHRQVLVHAAASLVSAGTERMLVEFASKSLVEKVRSRPDLVRQVLDKARRDGLLTTWDSVRGRLDQLVALGYSSAGAVIAVGEGVTDLRVGDRVACAGGGYAVHAEVVSVPRNLVAKAPENVDFEPAAFATLGAIALQGLRLAEPHLGERVAVIGLGLLGQLTVQMLKANGCIVLGMDIQPARAELARQAGAQGVATTADEMWEITSRLSEGHGADAVIITADTPSHEPVELAGRIARDRGVVVAVGAVGMQIPRKIYYEKELDFRISRSYGPGRYDPAYEEKGHDYPFGYVRWTENRNMQAFLDLVAQGKVDVKPLITHRFPIEDAAKAYELITRKTREPFLAVLLTYPGQPDLSPRIVLGPSPAPPVAPPAPRAGVEGAKLGLLGAGNFATTTLLPAMKKVTGLEFVGVCAADGPGARNAGDKFGFRYCTTDENEILKDPGINTVVIATRHHLHARQIAAALSAGKHVACEKPLALNDAELRSVVQAHSRWAAPNGQFLVVGFNRRFAPMARQLKSCLAEVREPLIMHYRVNAGFIPADHWVQDPEQGGGRVIGEVCHFVDFLTFLCGALPIRVHARALPNSGRYTSDNVIIALEYANGSLGTVTYVANGDKSFSKERVEVFGGGRVAVLDDFRRLELLRNGRRSVSKSWLRQDKGHRGEWEAFVDALRRGAPAPIPFEEIVAATLATFRILDALGSREAAEVETLSFMASASTREEK